MALFESLLALLGAIVAPPDAAAAAAVRAEYEAMKAVAKDRANPQADTEHDRLRIDAICAQRELLATLRRQGKISDDAFHRLEEELDWAELHASPREEMEMLDA